MHNSKKHFTLAPGTRYAVLGARCGCVPAEQPVNRTPIRHIPPLSRQGQPVGRAPRTVHRFLDCFVASLLAMTGRDGIWNNNNL
ncbi:MAG: hypothetical protein LBB85_05875 [Dysgonamonadaceae bacterium]|nr:hypothetical protein [Dysgonamonadaceae bacterium]